MVYFLTTYDLRLTTYDLRLPALFVGKEIRALY